MQFELKLASDWSFSKIIDILSINDLKELQRDYGEMLIIDFEDYTITIYDSWIE